MAKVAIATTTAAVTMTMVGAAAGVMPFESGPARTVVSRFGVNQAATAELSMAGATGQTAAKSSLDASIASPIGSASASVSGAAVKATGAGPTPITHSVPAAAVKIPPLAVPSAANPAAAGPEVSKLTQLPTQVLGCLAPVFQLVTAGSAVPLAQLSQLGSTVVGCVSGIVQAVPLPFGLSGCIAQILGFVSHITSQLPAGFPQIGDLNLASCIPSGLPVPVLAGGFQFPGIGFPFAAGGFPFGR